MKIYTIGNDEGIRVWLTNRGHDVLAVSNPLEVASSLANPDLVVFTGGSDVWPVLYGEKNTHSHCDVRRDLEETIWFHRFHRVPKLGICRGGQFLNVMSGGTMVQDRPYHAIGGLHKYYDNMTDRKYLVTSTHHQEMVGGSSATVVGVAYDMEDVTQSIECLSYRWTNSLCFQPHPEYTYGGEGNTTAAACISAVKNVLKVVI